MNATSFAVLFQNLKSTFSAGSRQVANGAWLIGHVPDEGPEAYLHVIYAPLDDLAISQIERGIGRKLPESLRELYRCANGVNLFRGALAIYGLQGRPVRVGDDARRPFSIILYNGSERPADAQPDDVFFGFYNWDGSQLVATPQSKRVRRCREWTTEVINDWPTLDDMLFSETSRLSRMFDEMGRIKDADVPTTPV